MDRILTPEEKINLEALIEWALDTSDPDPDKEFDKIVSWSYAQASVAAGLVAANLLERAATFWYLSEGEEFASSSAGQALSFIEAYIRRGDAENKALWLNRWEQAMQTLHTSNPLRPFSEKGHALAILPVAEAAFEMGDVAKAKAYLDRIDWDGPHTYEVPFYCIGPLVKMGEVARLRSLITHCLPEEDRAYPLRRVTAKPLLDNGLLPELYALLGRFPDTKYYGSYLLRRDGILQALDGNNLHLAFDLLKTGDPKADQNVMSIGDYLASTGQLQEIKTRYFDGLHHEMSLASSVLALAYYARHAADSDREFIVWNFKEYLAHQDNDPKSPGHQHVCRDYQYLVLAWLDDWTSFMTLDQMRAEKSIDWKLLLPAAMDRGNPVLLEVLTAHSQSHPTHGIRTIELYWENLKRQRGHSHTLEATFESILEDYKAAGKVQHWLEIDALREFTNRIWRNPAAYQKLYDLVDWSSDQIREEPRIEYATHLSWTEQLEAAKAILAPLNFLRRAASVGKMIPAYLEGRNKFGVSSK